MGARLSRTNNGRARRRRRGDYTLYEMRKAAWDFAHPGATAAEYQAAARRIAAACGV